MRKISIGFMSLAVVIGAFVLYSRMDKTPAIQKGTSTDFTGIAADSNLGGLGDANSIGKIGDVGIGTIQETRYVNYNENKQIENEWGFKRLLHEQGNIWELEEPYWNFYQSGFTCYMTADKGSVKVETAAGSTTPKDATFSGNVVIHLLPGKSGSIRESYIFLDNLVFLSDKSQLSTAGPIKLISENAEVSGIGVEIIYNDELERLELFKIVDLDTMQVKVPRTTFNALGRADDEKQMQQPVEHATVGDSRKLEQQDGQFYQCLFSKNVLIDTPEQLIFASQDVTINDIFFNKASNETIASTTDEPNEATVIVAEPNEPNEPSEQLVDVTITCDNGITITPNDSVVQLSGVAQEALVDIPEGIGFGESDEAEGRNILITQSIDYSMPTGDTFTTGPTELTVYVKDSNNVDPNAMVYPLKITAQKQAGLLKAARQVVFVGDCLFTMPQKGLTERRDVTLSAPILTINLPIDSNEPTSRLPDITAVGPAELLFYVEDSNTVEPDRATIPVEITAQKQVRFLSASDKAVFEGDCVCTMGSQEPGKEHIFSLKSPELTVNLPSQKSEQPFALTDIVATGPAELDFYIDDFSDAEEPNELLPVNIIAQKQASFLSHSKQILFEGPCRSTITREDPNLLQEFILLSERMTVDLPVDSNDRNSTSMTGIKHLTAEGGQVTLAALKKPGVEAKRIRSADSEKLLGFIKIQCARLDYDSDKGHFLATGPGQITLNDVKDKELSSQTGTLGTQWWAEVLGFETLEYLLNQNRIIAEAATGEKLSITYVTIEDGEYTPVIFATAGHADLELAETDDGQTDLSTIVASSGIDYSDDSNRFIGSKLFYNHETSIITIECDGNQPCYYNGTLVGGIKIDLKNNKVQTQIVGPGSP